MRVNLGIVTMITLLLFVPEEEVISTNQVAYCIVKAPVSFNSRLKIHVQVTAGIENCGVTFSLATSLFKSSSITQCSQLQFQYRTVPSGDCSTFPATEDFLEPTQPFTLTYNQCFLGGMVEIYFPRFTYPTDRVLPFIQNSAANNRNNGGYVALGTSCNAFIPPVFLQEIAGNIYKIFIYIYIYIYI